MLFSLCLPSTSTGSKLSKGLDAPGGWQRWWARVSSTGNGDVREKNDIFEKEIVPGTHPGLPAGRHFLRFACCWLQCLRFTAFVID